MQAHGAAPRVPRTSARSTSRVTSAPPNSQLDDDDDDESSGSSSGTSGRSTFRLPTGGGGNAEWLGERGGGGGGVASAFDDVIEPPPPPTRCMVFFDVESTGPSLRDNFVPCLGIAVIAITDDVGSSSSVDDSNTVQRSQNYAAAQSAQPQQYSSQQQQRASSSPSSLSSYNTSSLPYYYQPAAPVSASGGVSSAELWRGSEQWRRRQASFQGLGAQQPTPSSLYQQPPQHQQLAPASAPASAPVATGLAAAATGSAAATSAAAAAQPQQRGRVPGEPYVLFSKKWFIHAPPRGGDDRTPNKLQQRSWDKSTLEEFWYQRANRPLYSQIIYALQQTGLAVDAHTAMREFVAICSAATHGGRTECTLFSDTSGFDFSWLSYYLAHYGDNSCPSPAYVFGTYRPVRDVSSFFAGFGLSMPGDKSKQARYPHREAMRRLALSDSDWTAFAEQRRVPAYDHDPEHDATHVGMRSAWIMWSMSRLRAQEWKMVVVVRTDLRMKENRALSQCAHAAVGAYTRAVDADIERWQACGSAREIVRCADVQALFAARDAARDANINHYLYCCDRNNNPITNNNNNTASASFGNVSSHSTSGSGGIGVGGGGAAVPSVLALGPASAEALQRIVGHLKPL